MSRKETDSTSPFHGSHYSVAVTYGVCHQDIKGYGNVPRSTFCS